MGADLRVDGRVAIVTGAGRGIGAAIADTLAGAGAAVMVCDIEGELAEAQAARIRDAGHAADANAADVSKPAECDRVAEETERRHGAVHILVNCAAICPRIDIPDMTEPDYDRIMDTNLKSVYFLSRAAGRAMRRAGWGRIVNMTSVGARTGGMHRVTVYAASKAAVISMTKGFARHHAPDGILVNAVAPGAVDTRLIRMLPPEDQQATVDVIPLKRLAAPVEIARAVLFLASEANTYITGATTDVNGGSFMPD
ncbi:MAG: SDR family NAD(P)-dependent oxidoreductase [Spirochaetaceae bacterium]|nr:SDR family NAD(P)-dependent oxidoreductase [Spirochaetaceae bacterium]